MLEVTPAARRLVADYFKNNRKTPIRIFLRIGGCGIRSFGVALEGPVDGDATVDIDGVTYVAHRALLEKFGPITVDSDGIGFRLSGGGVYPPTGCGNCGYMCGVRGGRRCSGDCDTCEHPCAHGRKAG